MNSKYKQVKNIWSKKKNWKNFQRIREYISYKSLLEKYPLSEFFWSVFSRIRARKTPNTDTFHTVNPSFSVYIYPTKYLHLSFLVKFRKKNNHQKVKYHASYKVQESRLQLSFNNFRQTSTKHMIKTNRIKLQPIDPETYSKGQKGLGIVFHHIDFSRKIFLMLYSIN